MRKSSLLAMAAACIVLAGCNTSSDSDSSPPSLDLCGLSCAPDDGGNDPGTDPGTDPGGGGGGGGGGKGTGGNTKMNGGDTTIAFESGVLVSPDGGSYSRITPDPATNANTAKFEIDTREKGGSEWLSAQPIAKYDYGTNQPDFFPNYPQKLGSQNYTEYRTISASGGERDEVLQVWNFESSYATQYRALGNAGQAAQQAYSFGGTKTPVSEMPIDAIATYQGRYGSTAEASNWIELDSLGVDPGVIRRNGSYMSNGSAILVADFGTAEINGTLTPETWEFFQNGVWNYYENATDTLSIAGGGADGGNGVTTVIDTSATEPTFFHTPIQISGDIVGNTYSGKASIGGSFVSGDNPMYGAFFGAGAKETTGIFSVRGVSPQPVGGEYPINQDARGYLTHSGIFNAKCQAGGACTP